MLSISKQTPHPPWRSCRGASSCQLFEKCCVRVASNALGDDKVYPGRKRSSGSKQVADASWNDVNAVVGELWGNALTTEGGLIDVDILEDLVSRECVHGNDDLSQGHGHY